MLPETHILGPILVIEDSPPLQQSLQEILELAGYKVWVTGSAIEALQLLSTASTQPQLIITDLMMPKMDGLELFQQVRAHPQWQYLPFIFVSGSREKLDATLTAVAPDRILCLFKPFTHQELLHATAQALSTTRSD